MLVGPFDGRKKRSRCQACSTSHLKCSGQAPCTNCTRRHIACTFGPPKNSKSIILVERGRQRTVENWASQKENRKRKIVYPSAATTATATAATAVVAAVRTVTPLLSGLTDDRLCYLYYFDVFAGSNNFNGKKSMVSDGVRELAGLHSGGHLMDAMLALGALQAAKLNAPDMPSTKRGVTLGLEYYSSSIIGLRDAINAQSRGSGRGLDNVLWTTLFLGLFELMNEATGHGWGQHMIHGTAKALEASGPTSCRSGPGRKFFAQARVFEVSRTILFNESSFLTQPAWMDLSREMWSGGGGQEEEEGDEWRPLDSLLDIMVMCSRMCSVLRIRSDEIIKLDSDGKPSQDARSICDDSHLLREALESWYTSYAAPSDTPDSYTTSSPPPEDDSMLLSRIFFSSISIYLSGAFDYGITHWIRLGLSPSTLSEPFLETHTNTILRLTRLALDTTSLSPLLFLFPLRIAGARSREAWQREWVTDLVGRIRRDFAAAAAVQMDLDELWEEFSVGSIATDAQVLEY